jgi:CelD/BcsL family acetyltransferase involved in cellulose biosynthesis
LDSLVDCWHQTESSLQWDCLFVLPVWLKVWWHHFGNKSEPYILSVRHKERLIGIAPLRARGKTVRLVGEENVCDYLDFVVAPEKASDFYGFLLDYLKREGFSRLELTPLRPDSSVFAHLMPLAAKMGCAVSYESNDVSFELALPSSWDNYLSVLSGKERHEIRRKFRRLHEAGRINFRSVEEVSAVRREMATFLTLFRSNQPDKSAFMTDQMESFFQDLATELAKVRMIRLFFLEIDGKPIAAVMCVDYRSTMYLYNNGYDPQYRTLSAGLLCKVLSIKHSIQFAKKTYDLLKGAEEYKHRLGGKPVPLYQCDIGI